MNKSRLALLVSLCLLAAWSGRTAADKYGYYSEPATCPTIDNTACPDGGCYPIFSPDGGAITGYMHFEENTITFKVCVVTATGECYTYFTRVYCNWRRYTDSSCTMPLGR